MRRLLISALALSLLAPACKDPTKDKPKAKVEDVKPDNKTPDPNANNNASAPTDPAGSAPADPTANPTPAAGAVTYSIAPDTSTVGFVGSKVTASHEGTFKTFTGSIVVNDKAAEKSTINVEIDLKSLTGDPASMPEGLQKHLLSADFFDADKFPKSTFVSKEIKAGGENGATHTISGELELHGVKKLITFPAKVTVSDTEVTATSEFSINRNDFGIVYPGMANDLIRPDVLIKLNIKAPKKS